MTYQQFIDQLEDSYEGKVGDSDLREIKEFFQKNDINEIGILNLYNAIKYNYSQQKLPRFAHIVKFYNEYSQFKNQNTNNTLHPQSPLQQLYRAKDWPVEKIILNCELIRNKQDQVGTSALKAWEISFIAIWEKLKDVKPEFINIAKNRIINNANNELKEPVKLEDLMFEYKSLKINTERKEEIVNLQDAIGNTL